MRVVKSRPQI